MKKLLNNDLISIIVPAYNAELYLEDCILSLINQSYQNIEIIVINDGSTDNTLQLARRFEKLDHRVHLINQSNMGVYKTRIVGINNSKGKYLFFVDADDFIEPCCIQELYEMIIKTNADIVRCNFKYLTNGKYQNNLLKVPDGLYLKSNYEKNIYRYILATYDFNSVCMQLINRTMFNSTGISSLDLKYGEDLIFNCSIIYNSNSIMITSKPLYIYRRNINSYTHNNNFSTILSKINDILCYTEILDNYINLWNVDDALLFSRYLSFMLGKNIIYQLVHINSYNKYKEALNHINSSAVYNKIKHNLPYSLGAFNDKIFTILAYFLYHEYYLFLYFCLKLIKLFM